MPCGLLDAASCCLVLLLQGWWLGVCLFAAPSRAGGCIASMRGQSMQTWAVIHCSVKAMRFARVAASCVALAVMMAGSVLVCSTFKGRRMYCKHESAANASLWAAIHRSVEAICSSHEWPAARLCCSCTNDGWVSACVQHLQGQEDALQA